MGYFQWSRYSAVVRNGLFAVIVAVYFVAASSGASGQAGPYAHNAQKDRPHVEERFVTALTALSTRWNVVFVAEGTPRSDLGSPKEPPANDTLDGAVSRTAAEFDYSAVRTGCIVVLSKRYTDPRDLPDVTEEECQKALASAAALLHSFDPQFPPLTPEQRGNPRIARIARLLTPDQIAAMAGNGLPITDLSADERAEVARIAQSGYTGQVSEAVSKAADHLKNVFGQDPLFIRGTIRNVAVLGFQIKDGTPQKSTLYPISNLNQVSVSSDGVILTVISNFNTVNGVVIPSVDPTEPTRDADGKAMVPSLATSATTTTLEKAVAAINKGTPREKPYSVDPGLGSKRITLVGQNRIALEQLIPALAQVYGLRVAHRETTTALALSVVPNVSDLTQLSASVSTLIPQPLLHTLQMRCMRYRQEHGSQRGGGPFFAPRKVGNEFQFSLLQALRAEVEPKVDAATDHTVRLSSVGDTAKNMLGISLAVGACAELLSFCALPIPQTVTDLDNSVLTGESTVDTIGRRRLTLVFWHVDPVTGSRRQSMGFINALVP